MFSWTLCFITKKKRAESSKILNLFIHAPLLTRDDVRWYFPGVCDVSETTMWHSGQASTTNFPHVILYTKGDDSAKMDPVRCCFWRTWFWPFRLIATSSFDRIYPGSKHFVGSGCWKNSVSQCGVRWVSLTVPKHLDTCSTFHKADVTSHVVSWF